MKMNHENIVFQVKNVLVTSASNKVPLVQAVKKAALKIDSNISVIAGDLNEHVLTRYVADDFWKMPCTLDSEIMNLIDGCIERNINIVIPTRDDELTFWAHHEDILRQAGIKVIVSPAYSIDVCLDKLGFADFGNRHEMPFIPTKLHPNKICKDSFVVKERYGAGSRKIGLNFNMQKALAHANTLKHPIFQPYICGKEISIDAWLDKCYSVKGLVLRNRDKVVEGESQVTTTFRNRKLESLAVQILESLHLRGPVVMQAIIDDEKNIHIIECNPRFGGASTTSIAAGLDIFYWTLLESMEIDLKEYPFQRIKDEVRQIRIPCDIYEYDSNF